MANDYLQYADDLKRMVRGFTGAERLAAALDNVGSLEQASAEAEARLAALTKQVDEKQGVVDKALETYRAALSDTAAEQEKLTALIGASNDQAAAIIANAQSDAAAAVSAAKAYADGLKAQAEADVAEIARQRDATAAQYAETKARLDEVLAQIAKLKG